MAVSTCLGVAATLRRASATCRREMSFAGGGGDKNRHAWRRLGSIINWIGEVVPSRRFGGSGVC